jgi:hypothetical protein
VRLAELEALRDALGDDLDVLEAPLAAASRKRPMLAA